jgi:hypothetical protein
MNYSELAANIAKALRRDEATKQRLAVRVAPLGYAFDGSEAEMSAREFAAKLLAKLGLKPAHDPVAALDAYLTGLDIGARDRILPGNALTGGNRILGNEGNALVGDRGSAHDSAGDSFVDKYLRS